MAKLITVQYFQGCPNYNLAVEHVAEALRRLGRGDVAVATEEIADEEQATRAGFRGSPTILSDGVDPFADPAAPVGFACRVYDTPAGLAGAPSVEQLCEVLA